mgnify:CR=1 FL=1
MFPNIETVVDRRVLTLLESRSENVVKARAQYVSANNYKITEMRANPCSMIPGSKLQGNQRQGLDQSFPKAQPLHDNFTPFHCSHKVHLASLTLVTFDSKSHQRYKKEFNYLSITPADRKT